MQQPEISVIISTYNSEEWLEKVMWSYEAQTYKDFEMVIADDGSKQPTFDLIERMKSEVSYPIVHVWHEDNGFQKSQILNKAIVACNADYILMSDGDCMAREDYVEVHINEREGGYFLSGGYFMLPMSISKLITKEDILSQRCFNVKWLKSHGLKSSFKNNKLTAKGVTSQFLNTVTPTNASWNGHNASGWKKDIVAINGFDERMQYGGQDRELGERLFNYGLKSKQIRYSAVCLHLDHPRGYKTQDSIDKNLAIRATTKKENKKWTDFGIKKN
ncbi:glycosyltransferase family 2 protein [Winogradskyella sp. MIT101101]|uniref:glycosyltransferase family 2 protein n=1 Tax=Winogradskyella sp. MIT101101 TaxID=3098297 RepID=UPI003999A7E2